MVSNFFTNIQFLNLKIPVAQYVLSSVEVHFNDTFCRVLCGKSSMSTKWYFDVAVLTLGANIYRKLPFLIFTKSVFLKYRINFF